MWEGRVGVGSVIVASEEVEEVFEATRLDHANKLDEWIKQLESVGCPESVPALEAVEVLVVDRMSLDLLAFD